MEADIRPRGPVLRANSGKLLPQLLPRLSLGYGCTDTDTETDRDTDVDAGQHVGQVGQVEFIDCNLCSGEFLSVFASNVQIRSLGINNPKTVTDDPSELMRHVGQFEGLHDLSISLLGDYQFDYCDKTLLPLTDLEELQALKTLSLSNCLFIDIDVLQYLPSLLELNLHDVGWLDREDNRLISPSLQTLRIDKLTFACRTSRADLPALKQLVFSSFDIADAPIGDESQLRCMIMELVSLPLRPIDSENPDTNKYFALKFPSFRFKCSYGSNAAKRLRNAGHEHLMPILQVILESPLSKVLCSLKVVSLDLDAPSGRGLAGGGLAGGGGLGPDFMQLISDLFSGAEQIFRRDPKHYNWVLCSAC